MRGWDRLIRFWDWFGRLQLVWAAIGAPIIAVAYFAWAYLKGVPLPYLLPLAAAMLLLVLGIILVCAAIYDRFRKRSPLGLFIDPNNSWFWETAENPYEGSAAEEKFGEFYSAEVINRGEQTVQGISVVYWYDGETNHHQAYGTAKTKLSLDPGARKLVKLFFQPSEEYCGEGETKDPSPRQITVRAVAKDTLSSPDLRLEFQFTGDDVRHEGHIYAVTIRK